MLMAIRSGQVSLKMNLIKCWRIINKYLVPGARCWLLVVLKTPNKSGDLIIINYLIDEKNNHTS